MATVSSPLSLMAWGSSAVAAGSAWTFSEISAVLEVFELSGAGVLDAVPPQPASANTTASPAVAVCTLFLAFMVLPFKRQHRLVASVAGAVVSQPCPGR